MQYSTKKCKQHIIPVSTNHVLIDPAGPIDFTQTPKHHAASGSVLKTALSLSKALRGLKFCKQHPSVTAGDIFGVARTWFVCHFLMFFRSRVFKLNAHYCVCLRSTPGPGNKPERAKIDLKQHFMVLARDI